MNISSGYSCVGLQKNEYQDLQISNNKQKQSVKCGVNIANITFYKAIEEPVEPYEVDGQQISIKSRKEM